MKSKEGCILVCQEWEESERGWGVRPDGYSLHSSEGTLKLFVKSYNATLPKEVPEVYSRPSGRPFACTVDEETWRKVDESQNGLAYNGKVPWKRFV